MLMLMLMLIISINCLFIPLWASIFQHRYQMINKGLEIESNTQGEKYNEIPVHTYDFSEPSVPSRM